MDSEYSEPIFFKGMSIAAGGGAAVTAVVRVERIAGRIEYLVILFVILFLFVPVASALV